MKSLSHVIGLVGSVIVLVVALLALLTTTTLARLGETTRTLAEVNLEELQLLNQFQIALNTTTIRAAAYAQSGQRGALRDARAALGEADTILARLEPLVLASDRDGFAADRHLQRLQLVADAAIFLDRLDRAVDLGDRDLLFRTIQRLDLIAQDVSTLARVDTKLLTEQTNSLNSDRQRYFQQGFLSTLATFGILALLMLATAIASRRLLVLPLRELAAFVIAVGRGKLDERIEVRRQFEIGRLQAGVNRMADGLQQQQQALAERASALEQLNREQERLLATVSALDTPILPLRDGVLVLPLVGHVDAARADLIRTRLLADVYRRRAQVVIFDLTGLAISDPAIIGRLLAIADAVDLLGAQAILAGISPQLARQLVAADSQITRRATYRALGDALDAVMRHERADDDHT